MKCSVKALSHQQRVLGRVISGGSQASLQHEIGRALAYAIENGFFESRSVEGIRIARLLGLPFTFLNTFKESSLN